MVFADGGGPVAGFTEKHRQALQIREALKSMVVVLVSVLPGPVVVQTGQDHRAAGTAAGRRGKGITKTCAFGGQPVDVRSLDHRIAIDTGVLAMIIGHKKNHISGGGARSGQHRDSTKQDL